MILMNAEMPDLNAKECEHESLDFATMFARCLRCPVCLVEILDSAGRVRCNYLTLGKGSRFHHLEVDCWNRWK